MEIERLPQLLSKLKKLQSEALKRMFSTVVVGFTAAYALHVHENIRMKWRGLPRDRQVRLHTSGKYVVTGFNANKKKGLFWGPHGQAKFLEQPARELQPELARIIRQTTTLTGGIEKGLLLAGLRLQRAAQELVPVDTGNLRASAFTRVENKT